MRRGGGCGQCDNQVFEILQSHPLDHPKAGTPLRLGPLVDQDAIRITYVLTSGRRATITYCSECTNAGIDIRQVWKRVLAAERAEITDNERLGELADRASQTMLGELYRESWKELQDDAATQIR